MQKIKYIIIFTLLLALGLLYIQINDYDKITNTLLSQNRSSDETTTMLRDKLEQLENQNEELNNQITTLQEQIINLEQELASIEIEKIEDVNYTEQTTLDLNQEIYNTTIPINEDNNTNNQPIQELENITPSITLDDENKITGFGLEYKQEF